MERHLPSSTTRSSTSRWSASGCPHGHDQRDDDARRAPGSPHAHLHVTVDLQPWFEKNGIDAVVVPMGIKAVPHKVTTMALVDEVSPTAAIAGATNAVLRRDDGSLVADQFDGPASPAASCARGSTRRASARSSWHGGVGSPVAASLAGLGLAGIGLFDTRTAASEALAQRIARHYPAVEVAIGSQDPAGYDLVVNATPLGMDDADPMPVDVDRLTPGSYVGDVVLTTETTPFLQAAERKGCTVQVGTDMLFELVPAYLEFFGFGQVTPDELRSAAQLA